MASPLNLLICIPTYNEAENIEQFIHAVFKNCPPEGNILVIDDNSPDGTADIVEKMFTHYPDRLHIMKRPGKQGLGRAYLAAFDWGIARSYDVFLEMDADFSHNPKYIPVMLEKIQTHDVVIGSRNIKGGGVEGWPPLRNFISNGGSLYSRMVLGCPVKDLTGGFNMWRKNALEKIGLTSIISSGYLFQIEMKYKAFLAGCGIAEIPILFTDRKQGTSKMSKKILFEALINIWKVKKAPGGETGLDQLIKFSITGGLGTVTNLLIFFLCADIFKLPEIPVSIGCFLIAGAQNYIINHKWSFSADMQGVALSFKRYFLFLSGSLIGLTVNIIVMKSMIMYFNLPYKFIAQACGIAAGMIFNFIFSKKLVFRGKNVR
jgi:dolichol-phosphate mannosyltransferase